MTSGSTFPTRLSLIDALTLPDHWFLTDADECLYLGDYTAYEGYSYSDTNQLISNLKIEVKHRGKPRWKYKRRAIATVSKAFIQSVPTSWMKDATFVPIPPSIAKGDDGHDDRMLQVLLEMSKAGAKDVRELVVQTATIEPSHVAQRRHRPEDLIPIYQVDETLARPAPRTIVVVDDVLTTGSHFKAMQHVLAQSFPRAHIAGLFVARRVPKKAEEEFEPIDIDF